MTFLYSFYSTKFKLSLKTFLWYDFFLPTSLNTTATDKNATFLIHSYTYVVSISSVFKIQWWADKMSAKFKSTPFWLVHVDPTRHLSKFCLHLATSYPKCPYCFVWYGDSSLFFSLVYKNMGGFTPAEGLFTAKSVRLITMVPQSTQSRHFIGTYSQVSWWGVFVGHVKVVCSSACVHRQQVPCVDPTTDSRTDWPGTSTSAGVVVEQLSSQFSVKKEEWGRGGGSSLKQQSLPGGPTASCGYDTLCGAVTASCLSGARDGVEQWWRRWGGAGGWC